MLGNGVVGILSESVNKWERRVPLTPSHCARLLHSGREQTGVARIIVQPSTKRIHHDALYEDVGCQISDDLSECGLILGIKQPKLDMILPNRAYAFFSHTHKAQKENMPLLDKTEVPVSCQSAFAVSCHRMEERLAYSNTEQDMVLLHHEVEVDFPDSKQTEHHTATLLEFGTVKNGKMISAMALTVGVPVAIGALLLLVNKIETRGVLRPIVPEVYLPALDIIEAYGIKLMEKTDGEN